MDYTFSAQSERDFDQTIEKVTEELENQGFGVLTDIDVSKTMKKKLDEDFRKYRILGACNPEFAHEGLQEEIALGALLPCNVIVYEDSNKVFVEAIDPRELISVVDNSDLEEIAEEARERLQKVVESV